MDSYLDQVYWGNTVQAYLIAAGGIFIAWALIRFIRRVVMKRVKVITSKTDTNFDDVIFSVVERYALPYTYLLINYNIIHQLNLSPKAGNVLDVAMAVITTFYAVRMINYAIRLAVTGFMRRRDESAERIRQLNGVLVVVRALVWFVGFIALLGNLGYDVRTMIAGLGVGGIAIALAAQTVLGDLFSYFVIFFDKPFEIGDFVKTSTAMGTIEQIGIKTTRIRSLDGEQLVLSNTDLTKSTIHNYKRLERRRVVFTLFVTYSTGPELLQQIPTLIKEIVNGHDKAAFDRAHLVKLEPWSVNFEVIYNIDSPDLGKTLDIQQSVLLKIMQMFGEKGIEFANPTQTITLRQRHTGTIGSTGELLLGEKNGVSAAQTSDTQNL